jgi:hypothetical protein
MSIAPAALDLSSLRTLADLAVEQIEKNKQDCFGQDDDDYVPRSPTPLLFHMDTQTPSIPIPLLPPIDEDISFHHPRTSQLAIKSKPFKDNAQNTPEAKAKAKEVFKAAIIAAKDALDLKEHHKDESSETSNSIDSWHLSDVLHNDAWETETSDTSISSGPDLSGSPSKPSTPLEDADDEQSVASSTEEYIASRKLDPVTGYDTSDPWPLPPTTPVQGDDMHPPELNYCGPPPTSSAWHYNYPNTLEYYRFLIPDPNSGKMIVAPFIKFTLYVKRPTVSATYGKGFPIHTRLLAPTPVNYECPTLTPTQLRIFNQDEGFSDVIDNILQDQCPYDLVAGVQTYRQARNAQHALMKQIRDLQDRHHRYLERSLEILSELENANVLGRLLAHLDTMHKDLQDRPNDRHTLYGVVHGFTGPIPYSATDPRIEFDSMRPASRIDKSIHSARPHPYKAAIRPKLTTPYPRPVPLAPTTIPNKYKRCHKCYQVGHIRQECPQRKNMYA